MKGYLRIGGAFLLGAVIIAVGIYLRPSGQTAQQEGAVTAVPTSGREYIETQDSNGDGIKDWQEELQKKVIAKAEEPTADSEATDTPQTYTSQFARSFLKDYVENKAAGTQTQDQQQFIDSAVASIEKNTASKIYTSSDITVIDSSDINLHTYGNQAANVVVTYSIDKTDEEALILKEALDNNDPEVLKKLEPTKLAYKNMLEETKKISVPDKVVAEHLALLNGYQAMYDNLAAMENTFVDPLYAIARIKRYESDANAFLLAFRHMNERLQGLGITYQNEEPGILFSLFTS